jgi:tripartite-type tricarboxylate transporter receptor subunit TctC
VIETLSDAIGAAVRDPRINALLCHLGATPMPLTQAEFDTHVRGEIDKWAGVVESVGLTAR